jgi:voltage-gated potassium channel
MKTRFDTKVWLRRFAGRSEVVMFNLAWLYLICLAVLVVIWVDMPGLQERAGRVIDPENQDVAGLVLNEAHTLEGFVLSSMLIVWCIVVGEAIVHWLTRPWNGETRRHHLHSFVFCLCPALRMCARSPEMNGRIWLPWLGWRRGGRRLQRQLERHFSVPMMIIALLIMPILIIEFFLKDQVAAHSWLRLLLHIGTGVIWFAFAAEFILMVSIAEKKLDYCREHWIDLAIILLPVVSFLRSLRIARATRLANVMRIQQISKLARVYRLRGTAIKAFRVMILFDLTERILRISDERKIEKLEQQLDEMEKQSRLLRQRLAKLKGKSTEPIGTDKELGDQV